MTHSLESTTKNRTTLTRRQFQSGLAAGAVAAVGAPKLLRGENLNSKLNIAVVGAGGRGRADTRGTQSENIVALVDVDEKRLAQAAAAHPQAKTFVDYRELFEHPETFDAVVVAVCEHSHALPTMLALRNKKHVYCEKPLTHDVWEARQIRLAAEKASVATQMGIQIHAGNNYRRVVEMIQSGVIGKVHEAHVWVSRAWGWQSPEAAKQHRDLLNVLDRPRDKMPVPEGLHWDLWIGPAPFRPFHSVYYPGPKWYRWWDFGNGTMSDLGSHWNDLPFWALGLDYPDTIEAKGPDPHPEIAPASMQATYQFGARGSRPAVSMTWYQGENKPDIWTAGEIPQWKNGHLFIGDKGMLLCDYGKYKLLPEKDFVDYEPPEPTLSRPQSHHLEWINACKNGTPTGANFDYGGWLTETNHLGNIAFRVGTKIHWDPKTMKATNAPEADPMIRCPYRKGWQLLG